MSDKKNFDKKRYWLEKEAYYIKIKINKIILQSLNFKVFREI